jgi:hypothetical protein
MRGIGGARLLNPHKLKSLDVAKFKKAFSTSKPHFVDPVSGSALAFIPTIPANALGASVAIPIFIVITGTALVFSL